MIKSIIQKEYNNINSLGALLVITGPSGVGKDSVIGEFLKRNKDFHKLVTDTNRPPRAGEANGIDYNFFTYDQFIDRVKEDIYLEYMEVRPGEYKGTTKGSIKHILSGDNIILKTDEYAAAHIKEIIKKNLPEAAEKILEKTMTVYIAPEEWSQLREQYFNRESKANQEWFLIKLQRDKEMWDRYKDSYDHIVINKRGEMSGTVSQIEKIIRDSKAHLGRDLSNIAPKVI